MKFRTKALFTLFSFFLFSFFSTLSPSIQILSKSLDEQIAEVEQQISDLEKAIAPLKDEQTDIGQKTKSAQSQIISITAQIQDLEAQLLERESDQEVQKILLSSRVRRYYKNQQKFDPLLILLSNNSSDLIRQYSWYQAVIEKDRDLIIDLGQQINTLDTNKTRLETESQKLAALKKQLEERSDFLGGEIKKAEDYKAELSKKQQDLIAQKTALFSTSVGDVSSSQDPASRADYNPGFSPAFAAFSFGAPHRKGMSQFGAFGRAKSGQGYETILKAYYGDIRLETIDSPGSIGTSVGSLPFEDNYLLGIAEMPSGWGDEGGMDALRAQAIAARTYALSYVGWRMGSRSTPGSICTDEGCQVYSSSKASSVPDTWRRAVLETRGKIVVSNQTNEIISTWYASTSGGYQYSYNTLGHNTPGLWDTTCGSQSCWPADAYEKISDSPWYYKGWYKTRSGTSCNRSHPWLTESEFADIVNAALVYSSDHGTLPYLSQIDSGGCWGGVDPSAWSVDKVKEETKRFGGPVTSISGVTVDYSTGGYVSQVRFQTNRGEVSISGEDFKEIFTLRAPGAIHLKSLLFNIEKK
jgi:peptidoglycan hydrolase-like amidase